MKKIKFVLLAFLVIVSILCIVFARWEKLDYNIESYSYTCVKDDLYSWIEYDFSLSDDVIQDIMKNPDKYYIVTFDGTLYNNHIYNVYNWYITKTTTIDILSDCWIDSSPIEATFPLEPFSGIFTKCRVLIRCQNNEISQKCEDIIIKEVLLGKGITIISLTREYETNQRNQSDSSMIDA